LSCNNFGDLIGDLKGFGEPCTSTEEIEEIGGDICNGGFLLFPFFLCEEFE
jgi:hypothetical protein